MTIVSPAVEKTNVAVRAAARKARSHVNLVELFALDQLPTIGRQLVCHWHKGPDGRLICKWEPDLAASPLDLRG